MVAYSFQPQFEDPIVARIKRHTIRADRKRHARQCEDLQIYGGMRTRHCRLWGRAQCVRVSPIRLDLKDGRVEFPDTGRALTTLEELDAFAVLDGFADWRAMNGFWVKHHPGLPIFSGVIIGWGDTFRQAEGR